MWHLTPYPSSQIILMCSTGGVYKHNTEAISFAGTTLQQFGKIKEVQQSNFRQEEETISMRFKSRRNLKHNGEQLSDLETWGKWVMMSLLKTVPPVVAHCLVLHNCYLWHLSCRLKIDFSLSDLAIPQFLFMVSRLHIITLIDLTAWCLLWLLVSQSR